MKNNTHNTLELLEPASNPPLLTIITTTYNLITARRADFFKKCIKSVSNQTYPYIEHLVIDGASSDGTLELIEECKHPRMKVISQADNGLWEAMNTGARIANGKYICYLNSDDYYLTPEIIEKCINQLEETQANCSISNSIFLNLDGSIHLERDYYRPIAPELFFTNMTYMHETFICKKSIYEELGFHDEKYKTGIDYHFNIKLILADKFNYTYVDAPMLGRRLGGKTHDENMVPTESTLDAVKVIRDDLSELCQSEHENFYQRLKDHLVQLKLKNFNYELFLDAINKYIPHDQHSLSLKELPSVTIITVTYNLIEAGRREFFKKCVESVTNQTYPNIEHLIVDGASNDGTPELIEECRHSTMKVISQPDSGLWEAMNTGAKMAKGKYICYLNSDDFYITETIIARSVEQLEATQKDFSSATAFAMTYEGQLPDKNVIFTPSTPAKIETCYRSMSYQHETLVCKKSIYEALGYHDLKYKSVIDYQFNIALVLAGYQRTYINAPMLASRMGGVSVNLNGTASNSTIANVTTLWKDLYPFYPVTEEIVATFYRERILPPSMLQIIKEHYIKLKIKNFDYEVFFNDIKEMEEKFVTVMSATKKIEPVVTETIKPLDEPATKDPDKVDIIDATVAIEKVANSASFIQDTTKPTSVVQEATEPSIPIHEEFKKASSYQNYSLTTLLRYKILRYITIGNTRKRYKKKLKYFKII